MSDDRENDPETGASNNDDEFIKLRVMGQSSNEVHFKVKKTTTMTKLKKTYADRMGVNPDSLRWEKNHR
uniref:Rad60-SLD domain-containing protein n=1 Tax=Rhabditophanes sp. KR3021 TaxID=114890 RepID=A0AC35TL99_9BILA